MKHTASGLIIVGDTEKAQEDRPLNCGICGTRFRIDQMSVFDRHMARCANTEAGLKREQQSMRVRFPFFDESKFGDVEFGRWVRQNRKAIAEKRMKM